MVTSDHSIGEKDSLRIEFLGSDSLESGSFFPYRDFSGSRGLGSFQIFLKFENLPYFGVR